MPEQKLDPLTKQLVKTFKAKMDEIIRGRQQEATIIQRYSIMMAECAAKDEYRKAYEKWPRQILQICMPELNIPDDAEVKLDPYHSRWPVMILSDKEGNKKKIEFREGPMSVTKRVLLDSDAPNKHIITNELVTESEEDGKIEVRVDTGMKKDCHKLIIMPYFSQETERISSYKFVDDEEYEVILTSS